MGEDTGGVRPRLRFQGDWGGANLHRASGWLAQWVWDNSHDHRFSVVYTGRGMGDNVAAVSRGDVDIAFATPAAFAKLALDGRGPFQDRPLANLRALAVLPHRDAMIPVVRTDLGIGTLAELAASDLPLRVSLGVDDPDGFMGFGADIVLQAAGVDLDRIIARGGTVTRHEQPFDAIADLREGRADVMVSEAIMTPDWRALATEQDVTFLSLSAAEAAALQDRWALGTIEIPAGYFPGTEHPITALDYSDWICVTTTALDDETAALLARAVVEDSEQFARSYRHLPVDYSPLRYPIDARAASTTPIPLHRAAAAVYAAALESTQTGSHAQNDSSTRNDSPGQREGDRR
ncbi:TAXI family TRAP transporter solute-binding subunit [Microbacterium sp. 22242]|uniref:TAXI family TRAP transporter solute-binding subunit n=1 Tax=Microbacterium sp. 22242 TaxID=3453896 RepID=UPI003F83CCC5